MSRRDRKDETGRGTREFSDAAARLEQAIEELVDSASGAVNERATSVMDDVERRVRRLKMQVDLRTEEDAGADAEDDGLADDTDGERQRSRRGRGRRRHRRSRGIFDPDDLGFGSSRGSGMGMSLGESFGVEADARPKNGWLRDLYREPERGWIGGVCAGLGRYYEVEPWVARVCAFTLLLFIPQIAFWAYIAGIFLLAKRPRVDATAPVRTGSKATRSPAPELGPRLAPRSGIRSLRVRFRDLEHRLRALEEHVTSRKFTLDRELRALEGEGGA